MAFTQPATFNEAWSDERVHSYLTLSAPKHVNADYHVLLSAFKHMRVEDYKRLLTRFVADGRDLGAKGPHQQTIIEELKQFPKQSPAFIEALIAVGAPA